MLKTAKKILTPIPCPKCGKPAQVWHRINYTYGCGCLNPDCRVPPVFGNTSKEVMKEWNKRYEDPGGIIL